MYYCRRSWPYDICLYLIFTITHQSIITYSQTLNYDLFSTLYQRIDLVIFKGTASEPYRSDAVILDTPYNER